MDDVGLRTCAQGYAHALTPPPAQLMREAHTKRVVVGDAASFAAAFEDKGAEGEAAAAAVTAHDDADDEGAGAPLRLDYDTSQITPERALAAFSTDKLGVRATASLVQRCIINDARCSCAHLPLLRCCVPACRTCT
jgi:hypothetical protein